MSRDIGVWLEELGLGQYAGAFVDNDIELEVLPELSDGDLKELGLSLGHRRKLMKAIASMPAAELREATAEVQAKPRRAGGRNRAERRQLTVLFSDLVSSTTLSQRLDPEEMRDVLRAYQNAVSGEVARYEGHVAKFMGDGVYAYFGWPKAHEDQAERAVHAALGVLRAMRRLTLPDDIALDVRIGIASGQVVVGDLLGDGLAEEVAVTGETPNLAARLLEIAAPGQIVIAEATQRLIGNVFELRELGRREIKGFAKALPVWQVMDVSRVESRFEATSRQTETAALVGRTHELGLLIDRWQQAKAGEGQVVLLSGEAGIGKSRLVQALRAHVAEEVHFRLRYQCSPYHTNSALYPIIGRMERAAGFSAGDSAAQKLDKLERLLRLSGTDIASHMPSFASMMSLPLLDRYPEVERPAEQQKEHIFAALIDQLFALAARRPILSIYEDAHWIDPTTRELLARIVARIAGAPVLLIVTHRPEWSLDEVAGHDHVSPLILTRLAGSHSADMVRSIAGRPLDDDLVARIASRTDGVPLFVEELTRSIVEAGVEDIAEIPDTLQGLLQARLDGLTPEVREVAQVGAVIGREFRRDILARVIDETRDLDQMLEQLTASRLVLPAGSAARKSYVFRHALMQEAAYNSLLLRQRRDYHRATAEALIELAPEAADLAPELVAQHFAMADQGVRAIPYWQRAGERALSRSTMVEAIQHLRQGMQAIEALEEGPERLDLERQFYLMLGEAHLKGGFDPKEAMRLFNRAARLARLTRASDDLVRAALGFEHAEFYASQPEDASVTLLNEALGLVGDGDSPERTRVLGCLSRALSTIGRTNEALEAGREASQMARRVGDRRALFEIQFNNYLLAAAADLLGAQDALREANALAQQLGDVDILARSSALQGYNQILLGDIAGFKVIHEERRALATRYELQLQNWTVTSGDALLAILHGDFDAAERYAELALTKAGTMEAATGLYGMQMFTIRREQGRLAEVAPIFKRFVDDNPGESAWRPGLALIATDLGFLEPARASFEEMAADGFDLPIDAKRTATLSYLAEVCARLENAEYAERLYELLLPYQDFTVTVGTMVVCYGAAARYLGLLATTMGELDKAEGHFEAAIELNAKMDARPWLAHSQADYAAMLCRRSGPGDGARAEELLQAAWQIAQACGMVMLEDRIKLLREQSAGGASRM